MRRRGLTLVEVLVAMAVGALLLGVIQDLLFKGSSLLEKSHQHVEAAAGAQLLLERIHADVRRVATGDPFVSGGGSGPPFALTILEPGGTTSTVEYGTTPGPVDDTFFLTRNGRTLGSVLLKELIVRPEVPVAVSGNPIFGVITMLVATDGQGRVDFPLVDFTAVDVDTRRSLDPYWIPVTP